jgi:hypothetical protein
MQRLLKTPMLNVLRHAVIFAVVVFCLSSILSAGIEVAHAQTSFDTFADASTLSQESIGVLVARFIRIALSVVGLVFVSLIIYAGYLWFTAAGRPEPVDKAKKILRQAVIGLFIIFTSYSITTFILNRLLDAAYGTESSSTADRYAEPLSGSLGGGILDDHYPSRNATEIPRNTKIFVTFKEAIDLSTMVSDYETGGSALNVDSVIIYATEDGESSAFTADEVVVTYNEASEIFVFDPIDYLGSSEEDTNYTVKLTTNIETEDGDAAFTGTYSGGYEWTFEVSTEIDLTPPTVTTTIPDDGDDEARNISIEMSFSEAMDPVATTGTYEDASGVYFTNIEVVDSAGANVEGTFEISNGYRTATFTTFDSCSEDPCGDTIYCLPGNDELTVTGKAASINGDEAPQSLFAIADGLTDAAANSLDGDSDGDACGSSSDAVECEDGDDSDDHAYTFTTSNEIEDTVPHIVSLSPEALDDEISQSNDVTATFNTYLKASTIRTSAISMWPDPYYEMWFSVRKSDEYREGVTPDGCDISSESEVSCLSIQHPTLVSNEEGGWNYYPVFSNEIKSSYQICMYPSTDEASCDGSSSGEYCCDGVPSVDECQTQTQASDGEGETLPDNTETEE